MWFQIDVGLSKAVLEAAQACNISTVDFSPDVRQADLRFGDFQANGVLPYAKLHRLNPRHVAEQIVEKLRDMGGFSEKIEVNIAGPGFINFKLSGGFLAEWLNLYKSENDYESAMAQNWSGKRIIIDYSSPNTAKQMHVGHLRSMNIGDSIYRILKFCGADIIRDNHIGDWGTQFGILTMVIKKKELRTSDLSLEEIESLYQQGNALAKENEDYLSTARNELVKLQNGDTENIEIWETINRISQAAFDEIYAEMGVFFDHTLGESFYRDQVHRIYQELTEKHIAKMDNGALCVFHEEHEQFSEQPFIIRKTDGASNYATTDLATVLYRTETLHSDELIYVTDGRQRDHFQQLFLTVQKWYAAFGRKCPAMQHVWFGTILGEDGKAIKTRSGAPIKLKELLDEAKARAKEIIDEKSKDLSNSEKQHVANVLGIDSIKYADLLSNRTGDYVFSWEKMLSFDGNTAAYLLYAIARIKSILRKCNGDVASTTADCLETESERNLVRKLTYFPIILSQAVKELLPHHICTYLFELTGEYSAFYNTDRVIGEQANVTSRRLTIILRTLNILETGMHLLGLETLEKM
ncbi:MAG: arginine--tRNA ligase [Puniceicoccales bacterium]|jgi:arginyl-tRNA synthetase|nr:arginine--tRNA ligase [Puniceicoccales bacterium]